jgi:hypothetical protein
MVVTSSGTSSRSPECVSKSPTWDRCTAATRNSALVYTSVIVFGAVCLVNDRSRKVWFFDRVLEKYGQSDWTFEPAIRTWIASSCTRADRGDDGQA